MFKNSKYDKEKEAQKTLDKIREQSSKYDFTDDGKKKALEYLAKEARKKEKIAKFNKIMSTVFLPVILAVRAIDALTASLDKKTENLGDLIIRLLLGIVYLLEISAYVALVLMIAHWLMK